MNNNKISLNIILFEEVFSLLKIYRDLHYPDLSYEEVINKLLFKYLSRTLQYEQMK